MFPAWAKKAKLLSDLRCDVKLLHSFTAEARGPVDIKKKWPPTWMARDGSAGKKVRISGL